MSQPWSKRSRRFGLSRTKLMVGTAVLLALFTACSAKRPELVQPAPEIGTTVPPTIPLPDRGSCATATGPGPVAIVLAPQTVPCLVVGAHHRVEFTNQDVAPLDITVGATVLPLDAGGSQSTEPAGKILAPGPNRVLFGPDTVAVAWLAEPAEDPLVGATIGLSSIGDVELGFEPAAVTAATGIPVPAAGTACNVAALDGDPYSPLFTFRDGLLVVVQVHTPGLVTRSGIGLGATSADIAAAYGDRIETRPDPGGDPARQLLVFVPSDPENQIYRLVFDLTDDRVTTIRFGATEIVADQPGCGP